MASHFIFKLVKLRVLLHPPDVVVSTTFYDLKNTQFFNGRPIIELNKVKKINPSLNCHGTGLSH